MNLRAELFLKRVLRNRSGLFWGILFLLFSFPISGRAELYFHHWVPHHESHDVLRLNGESSRYFTDTNYDSNGDSSSPSGLEGYTRWMVDLEGEFGITDTLTLYGRLAWSHLSLEQTTRSSTAFGFSDQVLGLNYRIWEKQFGPKLDLQLQGDFPLFYSNTSNLDEGLPFLGDGSTDATAGAFLTLPIGGMFQKKVFLVGGGAFQYRTDDFSFSIPLSFQIQYRSYTQGFQGSLGLFGFLSLENDLKETRTRAGGGGSFASNAVNPSLMMVRGELGFRSNHVLSFHLFGSHPIWGRNAPQGLQIGGGLQYRFGKTDPRYAGHLTPTDYGKSNKGFVSYSIQAKVARVNDRLNLVKIDQGEQDGVRVGQVFDLFKVKKDGSLTRAIARAKVISVKSGSAALKIDEYFQEVWIEPGFAAKSVVD